MKLNFALWFTFSALVVSALNTGVPNFWGWIPYVSTAIAAAIAAASMFKNAWVEGKLFTASALGVTAGAIFALNIVTRFVR